MIYNIGLKNYEQKEQFKKYEGVEDKQSIKVLSLTQISLAVQFFLPSQLFWRYGNPLRICKRAILEGDAFIFSKLSKNGCEQNHFS